MRTTMNLRQYLEAWGLANEMKILRNRIKKTLARAEELLAEWEILSVVRHGGNDEGGKVETGDGTAIRCS